MTFSTSPDSMWRKSTYSGQQANCLEWRQARPSGQVAIRDSKSGAPAPHLTIPHLSWLALTDHLANRT